jgi:spore germination protein GerM
MSLVVVDNNNRIQTSTSIQDQLPGILTSLTIVSNNLHNFNDFNNYQRHSALYSQYIVLYYIHQTQDKHYIHQDISRNYLKKFCILVIANIKNSLKQCNGCDNTKWTSEQ